MHYAYYEPEREVDIGIDYFHEEYGASPGKEEEEDAYYMLKN